MRVSKGKVLIAAPVHKVLTEGLTALGYECVHHEKITQATAYELIKECSGVITSTRLLLDKGLIDAAPGLKWIGRMGSGMEVVDLEYAKVKGITCYSSPEGNRNAVGEHALGMLLALTHRIVWSDIEMKQGVWLREENRGVELEGKTIGLIGYGNTGSAFAKKLQGFDMNIMAYDKYAPQGIPAHVINCADLQPIFEQADIISFHVPQQADTMNYFDDVFLSKMRKPFILINTSRGAVVNIASLRSGIKNGQIIGACLDVFEEEPLGAMSEGVRAMMNELMNLPNVVVTPHIAGYTFEALYKMSRVLLDKIAHK
jgi:D-3-phosphoglycerate dehydrogenase